MEYISCNLCGADDTELLFKAKERDLGTEEIFNIVKCKKCGLVYINPRPDKIEIKKYYPFPYWPRANERVDINKATILNEPWQKIMRIRTTHLLKYIKNGKILDIGCGDGFFLKYLKEKGFEVYGVEPGEVASRYARDVLGLNVFTGELEDARYPDNFFDGVSLYAVLEHLPDPLKTLKEVKRILKPDGILYICVPNFSGLESKIFKGKWACIKSPTHLYHFTPSTLIKMLKKAGLTMIEMKQFSSLGKCTMGYSESLRYLLLDYHILPSKKYMQKEEIFFHKKSKKFLWKDIFHNIEFFIFKTIGNIADVFHIGSNLSLIAKK